MNENESTNTKQSDIVPVINPIDKDYFDNETFKLWYANTFPYIETDFDAVTSYRLLQKVVKYLNQVISNNNQVIDNVNILNGNVDNLNQAFEQLQNYVNEYFDGIQVVKIEEISHVGLIHRYRITFYNDYSVEFETKDGEPNKLSVGNVEQGPEGSLPQVTITGESPEQIINFIIPKGDTGNGIVEIRQISHDFVEDRYISTYRMLFTDGNFYTYRVEDGKPNTLTIGNVTKGDNASATIRGQAPNQILDLVLPKGDRGPEGPQGPIPDMANYVQKTDLASGNTPGIVKSDDAYGSHIFNGHIEGVTKTYNQYATSHEHFLICKKTLDNVLATHTRNITLFESQNGYQGDSVANGSEITLADAINNFDYIEIYSLFGSENSICTKIIPNTSNNQVINIIHSVLDYGRSDHTIPSNYFINFSYNNTTKKLSCTASGYYEPFVDNNNNIDNRITNTNTNAIQKIVGVKVLS